MTQSSKPNDLILLFGRERFVKQLAEALSKELGIESINISERLQNSDIENGSLFNKHYVANTALREDFEFKDFHKSRLNRSLILHCCNYWQMADWALGRKIEYEDEKYPDKVTIFFVEPKKVTDVVFAETVGYINALHHMRFSYGEPSYIDQRYAEWNNKAELDFNISMFISELLTN